MTETTREATTETIAVINPARLLYGMIITAAVLSTTEPNVDRVARLAGIVVFVLGIYWLADVYVRTFAYQFGGHRMPLGWRLRSAARHEVSVLLGGVPALTATVLGYAAGLDLSRAVDWALWLTVVLLALAGYLATRRAGAGPWSAAGEAAVAGLFGVVMIVVKGLMH